MTNRKRTNNDIQNMTQKTKDRATRSGAHWKLGVKSGAPEGNKKCKCVKKATLVRFPWKCWWMVKVDRHQVYVISKRVQLLIIHNSELRITYREFCQIEVLKNIHHISAHLSVYSKKIISDLGDIFQSSTWHLLVFKYQFGSLL